MRIEAQQLRAIRWCLRATVLLVIVGGIALWSHLEAEGLRAAQVQACERGNTIRADVNENSRILRAFLTQAAQAREHAATVGPVTLRIGNADTAGEYRRLAARLTPIVPIDCEHAIRG